MQEPGLTGANRLPGMVDGVVLGRRPRLMVRLPHGAVLQSLVTNSARRDSLATGQPVTVHLPPQSLRPGLSRPGARPRSLRTAGSVVGDGQP